MDNEVGSSENVVEVWIEELKKMAKQKNPFAHLISDSVESEIKAKDKDCSKNDCCGEC